MSKTELIPIKKLVQRGGSNYVTTVYVSPQQYKEHINKNLSSSKEKNIKDGKYKPDRVKLHRTIVDNVTKSCPKSDNPTVVLLLGGAASGKSTVVNKFVKPNYGTSLGVLNVDDIKESLPEYKKFVKSDVMIAASRVHEESADIGALALKRIINQKRNFIFDAVLGNTQKAKGLISELKSKGYSVKLVGVNVNAEEALDRATKRALGDGKGKGGSGRYVPDKVLLEGHRGSAVTFEEVKDLVDDYELYDNNVPIGDDPIKVTDNENIYHQDLYDSFLSKRNIKVESMLTKSINTLREIFSPKTQPITEDGLELTDSEILRIQLNVQKSIISDLQTSISDLHADYQEKQEQLTTYIEKAEEGLKERLQRKFDDYEATTLQTLKDSRDSLKKAENTLLETTSVLSETLGKSGDFKYKSKLTDTLERTRDSMPQIDSENIDDVLLHFSQNSPDSKVTKVNVSLESLKFAQNEINEDKVVEILGKLDKTKLGRFLVSEDNVLIDGHHRVAAIMEIEDCIEIPCYKIHLPAIEALRRLNLMKVSKKKDISDNDIKKAELINEFFNAISETDIKTSFDKGLIDEETFFKSQMWSGEIDGKQVSGYWRTINGSHVLVGKGGDILAGAGGSLGTKEDAVTSKKEPEKKETKKESKSEKKEPKSEPKNEPKKVESKTDERFSRIKSLGFIDKAHNAVLEARKEKNYIPSTGASLEALSETDISDHEAATLYNYTGGGYRFINNAIRRDKLTDEAKEYRDILNEALDKMPPFEGKVYRKESSWTDLNEIASMYEGAKKDGNLVQFTAFTSTSRDKEAASDLFGGDISYEIISKSGKQVHECSEFTGEQEVLFKSDSQFKVKSVKIDKIKGTPIGIKIFLEEA